MQRFALISLFLVGCVGKAPTDPNAAAATQDPVPAADTQQQAAVPSKCPNGKLHLVAASADNAFAGVGFTLKDAAGATSLGREPQSTDPWLQNIVSRKVEILKMVGNDFARGSLEAAVQPDQALFSSVLAVTLEGNAEAEALSGFELLTIEVCEEDKPNLLRTLGFDCLAQASTSGNGTVKWSLTTRAPLPPRRRRPAGTEILTTFCQYDGNTLQNPAGELKATSDGDGKATFKVSFSGNASGKTASTAEMTSSVRFTVR